MILSFGVMPQSWHILCHANNTNVAPQYAVVAAMPSSLQTVVVFTSSPAHWDLVAEADKSVLVFECKNSRQAASTLDAEQIREQFLGVQSGSDLKGFLNRVGVFDPSLKRFKDLEAWQRLIRSLMTTQPTSWSELLSTTDPQLANAVLQYRNHVVHFPLDQADHLSVIRASSALEAMVATVLLNHMSGIRHAVCNREDCGKLFRFETARERIYCSQYCAHLVSLRRKRREKQLDKQITTAPKGRKHKR